MTAAPGPPPLPAREAYRLWAESYDQETVISALDERAVSSLSPTPAGRALLDAGCGTARRLRAAADRTRRAVGVDLVPDMLQAARSPIPDPSIPDPSILDPSILDSSILDPRSSILDPRGPSGRVELAAGDLRALPLRSGTFDLIWCRLAAGHVSELDPVYAELGRVARAGADLVLTDFHPAAAAAGHVRSFRDPAGALRTIVHFVHSEADHRQAATAAGWTLTARHSLAPGDGERPFYERAGRLEDFEAHRALPLVLALCLTR